MIIKDFQVENQHLCMKVNNLVTWDKWESSGTVLKKKQHGITGIMTDDISDKNLEEKVTQVLSEIQVNV